MDYVTLNLKENQPTVNLAIGILEIEIERNKKSGVKAMKVIHGWGSFCGACEIKKALKNWLRANKRSGFIRDYCAGEMWCGGSEVVKLIKHECPSVLGDIELFYSNAGVTIILLQ